ncbi:Imm32 family immunity protein [Micromonospora sp. ZYX-F-536]|uniref:Imm32 family immunity protein n=1 Tax=Micromonospora sp. ZYX-F-536 TaxID=3457629 RepID=UPI004040B06C
MKVRYAESANELELSGTGTELRTLATSLRSIRGSVSLNVDGDPWPYDKALSSIEYERTSGHIVISFVSDRSALHIRGGAEELETFASMLEEFGEEGDIGAHIHIEPRPDHEFFAPDTQPLIIALVN